MKELDDLVEDEISTEILRIMIDWDSGHFTCCPHCGVDDFTHIEGRECSKYNVITRLSGYVRTLLQSRKPEPIDEEFIKKIIDIVKSNVWQPQVIKDIAALLQSRLGTEEELRLMDKLIVKVDYFLRDNLYANILLSKEEVAILKSIRQKLGG